MFPARKSFLLEHKQSLSGRSAYVQSVTAILKTVCFYDVESMELYSTLF